MKVLNFNNLGLSRESLNAVADMGYSVPTQIQHESIPHILKGRDVIGHSKTGTGKTMAFGLPAIEICDASNPATQVLVLCPTRELAEQAAGEIRKASAYKRINVTAVYGGASMPNQMRSLKNGSQIVVGTPGRIMDHMRRKTLKLGELKLLVLDEADEMLNMGFRDDIETVLADVPESSSVVMFSATMSKGIMQITKNYQKNAKVIKSVDANKTVATVDQWHVHVKKADKSYAVGALLDYHQPKLTLIFCNTKRMVDELVKTMQKKGIPAAAIHGDLNQNARNRVMSGFRSGTMPILVATDVAARGIDVDDVEMVINYDIPQDDEYYVHRIGRTGRAGRDGKAVTLISGNVQKKRLADIERYAKARIPKRQLPSQSEISRMKNEAFVDECIKELELPTSDKYFNLLDILKSKGYSERKISATLLKMIFEQKKAEPEQTYDHEAASSGARDANMVRFFINVGKKDKISSADIVGCIAGESGISGSSVGRVDIFDSFSFVEVQQQYKQRVLEGINNKPVRIRQRDIAIDVAKPRK